MNFYFSKNELSKVNPVDIILYLKSNGWTQKNSMFPSSMIWSKKKLPNDDFEVLVPLEITFVDYALRVGEAINVLEIFEGRSAASIYRNLLNSSADVIQIRGQSAKTSNGTLPLNDSYSLLGAARDLITAAACSTLIPKATYPSRKPDKVMEFMDKVHFDHTEKGSFIISISTRIPPILKLAENSCEAGNIEEPFERRVMMNLMQALDACHDASKQAIISNNLNAFEAVIEKGVSANLCEAIVNISKSCGDEHLGISIDWSLSRPAPINFPKKVEFNQDFLPYVGEAARTFKEIKPIEEFELKGVVIKLTSEDRKKNGEITVFGLIDGQQRKVNVKLEKINYDIAIKAHEQGIPICCYGALRKQGTIYSLANPYSFSLTETT